MLVALGEGSPSDLLRGDLVGHHGGVLESDVARLAAVCVSVVGLGLVAGTSPTFYALVLRVLSRGREGRDDQGRRPLGLLLVGYASGTTLLAVALQVVDPRTIETVLRGRVERAAIDRGVDVAAGVILLLVGVYALRRSTRTQERRPKVATAPRPGRLFVVGVLDAAVSISSLAPVYVAARTVRGASEDDLVRLGVFGVFLAAVLGPYLLLVWAWDRFPVVATRLQDHYARLSRLDPFRLAGVMLVVTGAAFLVLAVRASG